MSVGQRGTMVNIGSRGIRGTVGIPGTGLSWSEMIVSNKRATANSRMRLADRIEAYRNVGGALADYVNGIEQIITSSYTQIKDLGHQKSWPVQLEIRAELQADDYQHWVLYAVCPGDSYDPLPPGMFLLASCNVNTRDGLQRVILSMIEGVHPENIPSPPKQQVASTPPVAAPQVDDATKATCLFSCLGVVAVVVLIALASAIFNRG